MAGVRGGVALTLVTWCLGLGWLLGPAGFALALAAIGVGAIAAHVVTKWTERLPEITPDTRERIARGHNGQRTERGS